MRRHRVSRGRGGTSPRVFAKRFAHWDKSTRYLALRSSITVTGEAERGLSESNCRGKWNVSSQGPIRLWIALVAAGLAAAQPGRAQYPGQIANAAKDTPELRAIAVMEWTGDADRPKASRIVPVCIYDGRNLQDAGVYLAHPEPLALESGVEYELQRSGRPVGLFQVENATREQGAWVGLGKLKPLPVSKPTKAQAAKIDEDDSQSDVPILHRRHHSADSGDSEGSSAGSDSGHQAPADPDRPTLHRSPDASNGSSTASAGGNSGGGTTSSQSGGPTLHRGPDASSSSSASSASASDSGRPKLKKKEEEGYVEDVATVTDPERPHLFYGKTSGYNPPVVPSLMGIPPEMHQEVAVSDLQNKALHMWSYIWANPDDERKMAAELETLARTALSLNPPPAPAAKPAPKTAPRKAALPVSPPTPPFPAPLLDEQLQVFELAYGSGATMVFSAHTDGVGAQQKFVTLIAQPNLYGDLTILMKNVTDAAHLDQTPRMELVDAVDAMADNRGELLFELRGQTQRQFALYRVLRGQATQLFVSGPDSIGSGAAPVGN